jgi:hypothetical protein
LTSDEILAIKIFEKQKISMPSNFKKPLDKILINVKAGWHGVGANGTPQNGGSFLMFFKKDADE